MVSSRGPEILTDGEIEDAYVRCRNRFNLEQCRADGGEELARRVEGLLEAYGTARTTLLDSDRRRKIITDRRTAEVPRTAVVLSAEFHFREGQSCLERGDLSAALEQFEAAHSISPDEPPFAGALALVLLDLGREDDRERVHRLADLALEARPRQIEALVARGELCVLAGETERARHLFRMALEDDPHHARALRAQQALEEQLASAEKADRWMLLASDLLFHGSSLRLSEQVQNDLRRIHSEVFGLAVRREMDDGLRRAGRRGFDVQTTIGEGVSVVGWRLDDGLETSLPELMPQYLAVPLRTRQDLTTKFELHLINTDTPAELQRAFPACRCALAAGEGILGSDSLRGPVVDRIVQSVQLDTEGFAVDEQSAQVLSGQSGRAVEVWFSDRDFALRPIAETRADGELVYAARHHPRPASEPGVPQRQPRRPKNFVRPSRKLHRAITPEELAILTEIREEVRARAESDLTAKFTRLKEERDRRQKKSIWRKMVIGRNSGSSLDRIQIPTRLFAPLLGESRVHMGIADFRRWFGYLDRIATEYVDALSRERDTFVEAGRQIYDGLAVDRTFEDFEDMDDLKLLAVSEALYMFPLCLDPDEQYEEITLAEFARIAASRFEEVVGPFPRGASVLPQVYDIYRRAIDTPDDSVEPVNLWQWATLLGLLGVTQDLREEELELARDIHGEGSRKLKTETERIVKTFDHHLGILREGLHQYHRIRQVLLLRSPLTPPEDRRGIFEKGYDLPLFHYVKGQSD